MITAKTIFPRIIFVYAKDGRVRCLSYSEANAEEAGLLEHGWQHTLTIDPCRWIESLCNGEQDPSDAMDELYFGKKVKTTT